MTKRGNEVECVGTVGPDERLNLPLDAVYTPTNIYWLFFSINGYDIAAKLLIIRSCDISLSATERRWSY